MECIKLPRAQQALNTGQIGSTMENVKETEDSGGKRNERMNGGGRRIE